MSTPLAKLFSKGKPIIGMVHVPALPGSPRYDPSRGMKSIREKARNDALSLQDEGLDGVLFCNEYDRPYSFHVGPGVVAGMTDAVARVAEELEIPYGIDVLWDPIAAVSIAAAVGARFVREVFTGVYASDMGLWQPDCAAVRSLLRQYGAEDLMLFANIVPEFCSSLDRRPIEAVARSVVTSSLLEVLLVSGLTAGTEANLEVIRSVKAAVPGVAVLANTGVRLDTVERTLRVADGAIVGTYFKRDGVTWNDVDPSRVREFMRKVNAFRESEKYSGTAAGTALNEKEV